MQLKRIISHLEHIVIDGTGVKIYLWGDKYIMRFLGHCMQSSLSAETFPRNYTLYTSEIF